MEGWNDACIKLEEVFSDEAEKREVLDALGCFGYVGCFVEGSVDGVEGVLSCLTDGASLHVEKVETVEGEFGRLGASDFRVDF